MLRTYVYIDGFNLYYRALRGTPYRWLDLKALCGALLRSENQIDRIRYYTADVSARLDPETPKRQHAYLAALRTIPELRIHKGTFLATKRWAYLADQGIPGWRPAPTVVRVLRTEEKGSDVNVATHLVRDGFLNRYDVAVLLTNDTDLVEPVRVVTHDLGKPVGLICPAPQVAVSLGAVASFIRHVTPARLHTAQFPDALPGTTIQKPLTW